MGESTNSTFGSSPSDGGQTSDQRENITSEISTISNSPEEKFDILRAELAAYANRNDGLIKIVQRLHEDLLHVKGLNQRLAQDLNDVRSEIASLREGTYRPEQRSPSSGIFLQAHSETSIYVFADGRKMSVNVNPSVRVKDLRPGELVVLDESHTVVFAQPRAVVGEVVTLKRRLDDNERALVTTRADEERVVRLTESLKRSTLNSGDILLLESDTGYILERMPRPQERWLLDEIPDVNFDDIGGLAEQIRQIRDTVEMPYLHLDLYERFRLQPPTGILLYGPPGCGKTMIAKAMANSLSKQVRVRTGKIGVTHFLSIRGPELLDKYVGETERHIRLVFERAREFASEGMPIIVFFDQMDAIFRSRASTENTTFIDTIVPQLVSEIDEVKDHRNILVVGTSSSLEAIDSAILRAGRINIKIRIDRPNEQAALEILARQLTPNIPIDLDELASRTGDVQATMLDMARIAAERIYDENDDNALFEVTYANGDKEILYFRDFSSGTIIRNLVERAKSFAITRFIESRNLGLRLQDLLRAAKEEFKTIEDLIPTESPDDWTRISGRKGERVVYVRSLTRDGTQFAGRSVHVNTAQYL